MKNSNIRKALPPEVYTLAISLDSIIVGNSIEMILDRKKNKIRDYDMIVPVNKWSRVGQVLKSLQQHRVIVDVNINSFGGWKIKFKNDGPEVDIWVQSLEEYIGTLGRATLLYKVNGDTLIELR